MMFRRGLAALLIAVLAVPLAASANTGATVSAAPIGSFSYSNSVMVGGASALAGTTVFSGDTVEVGPRGSAGILLNGGMQVLVSSASRLRLKEIAAGKNQFEMEMFSGAARFRTSAAAPLLARLADATVRAKGANSAVGIISVLSRNKAIIGAEQGELLVSTAHDGKSLTLHEGETLELTLANEPASAQKDADKGKGNGNGAYMFSGKQIAVLGSVLAGSILLAGITVANRNNGLTRARQQDLISPFRLP